LTANFILISQFFTQAFLRPHHFSQPGLFFCVDDITVQHTRHPEPRQRPLSDTISRTLQKSDRALLTSSTAVTTSDDDTSDQQSMILGAPLTAGNQLHLDLQQSYMIIKSQTS